MRMRTMRWMITGGFCSLFLTAQANPIPVVEVGAASTASTIQMAPTAAGAQINQGDAVTRLLQQLDAMQQEVAAIRGQVEELQHKQEQMKQQQRDRYLDLDRRLSALALQTRGTKAPETPATETKTEPANQSAAAAQNGKAPIKAAPVTMPASEEEAYQAAFKLIRQRDFAQAVVALEGFLKQYPQSDLTANAQYWLGEVQLAQSQFAKAKTAFEQVIDQHPKSTKVSDATYKLGRTLIQMGEDAEGKAWLKKTKALYPDSSAARLASEYLKGLN